ncbi:RNA polymerase sigma-70 factor [Streptomyces sp. B-S-A8]|uniref:RNA polymerase sigma-70 factor n=1 Tax=Streptomyces solicavernae TaxID=3043614 RepID=A0ABT6RQL6_9ACTN|nr:RNA polymerase sigma-70 factor [Streptomyces sp. B-S-A8]MDI3386707.1 RNA polymerase sigma-70 factor [Streptomyces sp. B-S-A8]
MTTTPALAAEFETHRPRMFALAYRLLGSAEEADDAVQDAYLRWSGAVRADIREPAAWLAKVVTNLCVNRLTSARARREEYVGPWLPEPVVTGAGALGPLDSAEQRDSVSTALLVLLERLTPAERAVYVLREAFAYRHREIAQVLEVTEANARQLYGRAVRRVAARTPRFVPRPEQQRGLVESFIAAAREGDVAGLEKLLADDVTWWGDGGGRITAARRPIVGREKVLRFLAGSAERFLVGVELESVEVNGWAALVAYLGGELMAVASFDVRDGVIADVRVVVNPDKLTFVRRQLEAPGRG